MDHNMGRKIEKPTPAKKIEPTNEIRNKGGDMTPGEALARDKSSVRQPVKP